MYWDNVLSGQIANDYRKRNESQDEDPRQGLGEVQRISQAPVPLGHHGAFVGGIVVKDPPLVLLRVNPVIISFHNVCDSVIL